MKISTFKVIIATLVLGTLFAPLNASARLTKVDEQALTQQVLIIQEAVNNGDSQSILNLTSAQAPGSLRADIQANIEGKNINYQQQITDFTTAGNEVHVSGKFFAEGRGVNGNWNINGFTNNFVFEKVGNQWLLKDSDFAAKMNTNYVLKFVGYIFLLVTVFGLPFILFWIWMIIDLAKRDTIPGKAMWWGIVLFFNIIGAIIYFLTARRTDIKAQQQHQAPSSSSDNKPLDIGN